MLESVKNCGWLVCLFLRESNLYLSWQNFKINKLYKSNPSSNSVKFMQQCRLIHFKLCKFDQIIEFLRDFNSTKFIIHVKPPTQLCKKLIKYHPHNFEWIYNSAKLDPPSTRLNYKTPLFFSTLQNFENQVDCWVVGFCENLNSVKFITSHRLCKIYKNIIYADPVKSNRYEKTIKSYRWFGSSTCKIFHPCKFDQTTKF